MKRKFTILKIVNFVFLLWSGVVANAQGTGQDKNVTISLHPSRSIPATSASSITRDQDKNVTISLHPSASSIMRGQDKNVTISLHPSRSIPTTPASYIMRGTNLSSTMQLNSTSVMPPIDGEMKSGFPKLGLIVGCIAGAVIVAAAVIIICCARNLRRKQRMGEGNNVAMAMGDNLAAGELGERELQFRNGPDHFVERSRDVSIKMSEHSRVSSQYPPAFTEDDTLKYTALYREKQRGDQSDNPASFYNDLAEADALEEEDVPKSDLQERRSKTLSMRPGLVKKKFTVNGGNMKIDDIELNVSPGCLEKDTEITLIKDDQNPAFKSLLDLDLVKAVPRVVEFLPDGLKFLKPAELSIKYEKIISDVELFILHGSYNRDYQRTVWELVTNDIEDNRAGGVVNMKINGFCFFSYIYAKRGELSRILSHLNHAFTCRAYALYRRVPYMDTIDFSVVLLSKFIEKKNDVEDIQQLKDHFEAGYEIGEKGMLKRVHTDRSLEMTLGFPGIEQSTFALKVDQPELDSVGFVIDHFKGIDLKFPSMGTVEVYETHRTAPKKLLWKLNVREEAIEKEKAEVQMGGEDEEQVVFRSPKLSRKEISRMSRVVDIPASYCNDLAEEDVPKSDLHERRSKTLSTRRGLVKKKFTVNGGNMKIDVIKLNVGPGCLAKDTEITLIKDDQNPAFKSLLDLDLVKAALRVVEFLPDGLKFLKPAELSIKYEKIASDAELCILHGSYNRDYQRTVWELVTNDIEDNRADGVVNMKINGFCFFGYIFAERGMLSRILSHLNHEFRCRAYSLYRRVPFKDTMDIVVVLLSEFVVDEYDEKGIQQLKHHFEDGYIVGEKGALQRVHTDRSLEISLSFSGIQQIPIALKVDQVELDTVGFVTDHFKGTYLTTPAFGMVNVYEVHRTAANKLLWKLSVREIEEQVITKEIMSEQLMVDDEIEKQVVFPSPKLSRKEISPMSRVVDIPASYCNDLAEEDVPKSDLHERRSKIVCRKTKLRSKEITRMSRVVGVDWDSLAGLMDIPYSDREEIRVNSMKYPDSYSKAGQIFALFNGSQNFDRHILERYVHELGRLDVISEMLPVENENDEHDIPQPSPSAALPYENVVLKHTPLSPREMYRLSRKIVLDWDSLAGLMDIANEERQKVRCNQIYEDDRARAEKILWIINHQQDFSRDKLAEGLEGIEKLDLIKPITTGQWRNL